MKQFKPTLLLHLCCGPCGAQISEDLQADYRITLLFANDNLDTEAEWQRRLAAAIQLAGVRGLPLVSLSYDHGRWLKFIKGYENEPERGARCRLCYRYRLAQTWAWARQNSHNWWTSSLSVSPHKDGQQVLLIGQELAKEAPERFLAKNFNAENGFARSVAAAKSLALYRQNYCGCEFSRRSSGQRLDFIG